VASRMPRCFKLVDGEPPRLLPHLSDARHAVPLEEISLEGAVRTEALTGNERTPGLRGDRFTFEIRFADVTRNQLFQAENDDVRGPLPLTVSGRAAGLCRRPS
jgi:hypothetical protein